ncbi:MAG: ABC transporter permease [Actinomycetes bacterium]
MIRGLLVIAALLGLWEIYCALSGVDQLVLPSPADVGQALWRDREMLWSALLVTGYELIVGLGLALLVATIAAIAIHMSRSLRNSVYPLLIASQTVPIPVIASLLVVWLGYDTGPKVVIVALVAFFPVVVGILDGLAGIDPELDLVARSFGAGRLRRFRLVEAPAALPGAFTGLRIAVVISVIGAVFAEQAGGDSGLGFVIQQALPQLLTARAYAAVVVLSGLALTAFVLLAAVQSRLLPWTRLRQSEQ